MILGIGKRQRSHLLVSRVPRWLGIILTVILCVTSSLAQARQNFTLFGDVKVDTSQVDEREPLTLDVFLYKGGNIIGRQRLGNGGRYKFMNLLSGMYEVSVEIDNVEVARLSQLIAGQYTDDVRLDINLRYRPQFEKKRNAAGILSVAESYPRTGRNKSLYQKALSAIDDKDYSEAITSLSELVTLDSKDYPAWFQLGVVYFVRKDYQEAERCFVSCSLIKPSFVPPIFNLGRVRLARKNYQGAVEALDKILSLDPQNSQANYFLGESYLQLKKGSLAVGYFNQALKLDPLGMADAHLRLASLYNVAGYKELAAAEYVQFLKKKPDYPQKKKLEEYILTNKTKPTGSNP
jgi:tetratricopeptide (TPR) repeat protein